MCALYSYIKWTQASVRSGAPAGDLMELLERCTAQLRTHRNYSRYKDDPRFLRRVVLLDLRIVGLHVHFAFAYGEARQTMDARHPDHATPALAEYGSSTRIVAVIPRRSSTTWRTMQWAKAWRCFTRPAQRTRS